LHTNAIPVDGNREDFRCYIRQELNIAGEEQYRNGVIDDITERSQGNFLWIHLAVQRINKCLTKWDVDAALKDLPPGMGTLYDRMASEVQNKQASGRRNLGYEILGLVCCSQRR
jgi:hypothetical protein